MFTSRLSSPTPLSVCSMILDFLYYFGLSFLLFFLCCFILFSRHFGIYDRPLYIIYTWFVSVLLLLLSNFHPYIPLSFSLILFPFCTFFYASFFISVLSISIFFRYGVQFSRLLHRDASMHSEINDQHWAFTPQPLHCQSEHRRPGSVCFHHPFHHPESGAQVFHFQHGIVQGGTLGPRS